MVQKKVSRSSKKVIFATIKHACEINDIVLNWNKIKGIKINPSTVKDPSHLIIDIVSKDKEFRYFAFGNYYVYIEYNEDLEMFFIHKATDEMLELISKSSEEDLDTKQLFDELCYLEDGLYHPEKKWVLILILILFLRTVPMVVTLGFTGTLLKILILKFLQRSIDEIFCKVLRLYLLAAFNVWSWLCNSPDFDFYKS